MIKNFYSIYPDFFTQIFDIITKLLSYNYIISNFHISQLILIEANVFYHIYSN